MFYIFVIYIYSSTVLSVSGWCRRHRFVVVVEEGGPAWFQLNDSLVKRPIDLHCPKQPKEKR